MGCGSPRECGPADYIWEDTRCGADGVCTPIGDGLSYARCSDECLCPAAAQYCSVLGLYSTGDFICNAQVQICMSTPHMDCPTGSAR